mgnify:CR=1 FL=1
MAERTQGGAVGRGFKVSASSAMGHTVDNLLTGCLPASEERPLLLRFEADFVTCTQ